MKTKKLLYVLGVFMMMVSLASFASAKDNENKDDDRGDKNAKEARAERSALDVHIFENGKVQVDGAKVTAVSGSAISASTSWGSASVLWAINAGSNTKVTRRSGGKSSFTEVSVGDVISFKGTLVTTVSSPFTVNAEHIKNYSIDKINRQTLAGSIKSVDSGAKTFVLSAEKRGEVVVMVSNSTVIKKSDGTAGTFADIAVGDKAMARGIYDPIAYKLTAEQVRIYAPEPLRTTLEGVIKSIGGITAPTSIAVISDGKEYKVNIAADTLVVNGMWLKVSLATLSVGDKVKVHGIVNPDMTVNATVFIDPQGRR